MRLDGKNVLVVGGSSGIGEGAAKAALALGARVTIASRSAEKVAAAAKALGCEGTVLDTGDEGGVEAFFRDRPAFDHVIVSASQTKVAAVRELPLEDAYRSMNSKFFGAYRIARAAKIAEGGSLTLVSGFLSIRPKKGAAIQASINAAVEALAKGLALELAPIRVNCVSPGLVMTPLHDRLEGDTRKAMFVNAAANLPAGLVGTPEHIATQIMAFLLNPFMTGSVVYLDGGGALV